MKGGCVGWEGQKGCPGRSRTRCKSSGVQDGGVRCRPVAPFTWIYGKNHQNIVTILHLKLTNQFRKFRGTVQAVWSVGAEGEGAMVGGTGWAPGEWTGSMVQEQPFPQWSDILRFSLSRRPPGHRVEERWAGSSWVITEKRTLHRSRSGGPSCEILEQSLNKCGPLLSQLWVQSLPRPLWGPSRCKPAGTSAWKPVLCMANPLTSPSSTALVDNGPFKATQCCADKLN